VDVDEIEDFLDGIVAKTKTDESLAGRVERDFLGVIDDTKNILGERFESEVLDEAGEDFAVGDADNKIGELHTLERVGVGQDDFGVVGERERAATDDVDVALVKFAKTALLGALAAEVAPDLGDTEGERKFIGVLDDIASERDGVIEAQSLVGGVGGFQSLEDFVDLFLGIATGFDKKNLGAVDGRGLDMLEGVGMIYFGNGRFEPVEDGLVGRKKLLHA